MEELEEHGGSEDFEVLPENWDTVGMWMRVQTQWRTAGFGNAVGLDYSAVWATLNGLRIKNKAEIFDGLQVMELAALAALKD